MAAKKTNTKVPLLNCKYFAKHFDKLVQLKDYIISKKITDADLSKIDVCTRIRIEGLGLTGRRRHEVDAAISSFIKDRKGVKRFVKEKLHLVVPELAAFIFAMVMNILDNKSIGERDFLEMSLGRATQLVSYLFCSVVPEQNKSVKDFRKLVRSKSVVEYGVEVYFDKDELTKVLRDFRKIVLCLRKKLNYEGFRRRKSDDAQKSTVFKRCKIIVETAENLFIDNLIISDKDLKSASIQVPKDQEAANPGDSDDKESGDHLQKTSPPHQSPPLLKVEATDSSESRLENDDVFATSSVPPSSSTSRVASKCPTRKPNKSVTRSQKNKLGEPSHSVTKQDETSDEVDDKTTGPTSEVAKNRTRAYLPRAAKTKSHNRQEEPSSKESDNQAKCASKKKINASSLTSSKSIAKPRRHRNRKSSNTFTEQGVSSNEDDDNVFTSPTIPPPSGPAVIDNSTISPSTGAIKKRLQSSSGTHSKKAAKTHTETETDSEDDSDVFVTPAIPQASKPPSDASKSNVDINIRLDKLEAMLAKRAAISSKQEQKPRSYYSSTSSVGSTRSNNADVGWDGEAQMKAPPPAPTTRP